MALPQVISRNTTQRAGNVTRVQGRITVAGTGLYTVPAGKRTRVTDMLGRLNAVGVDATYGISFIRAAANTLITIPKGINIDMLASEITLQAGDILTNVGDAGSTNGTFDLSATIEEFTA